MAALKDGGLREKKACGLARKAELGQAEGQ